MDYPKSVPGVGLVDGKFVDENPATGQIGSLIPAPWGNAVTEELLNVLKEAGIEPDEANVGQVLQGLKIIFATLVSPAFKGEPTAPTPPVGDKSERIATTETVAAAVSAIDVSGKQDKLGFTPVQQGTGIGQLPNIVKIGWDGIALKATVDVSDQGCLVFGKQNIRMNWNGLGGQPTWLFGGEAADNVNVYNPTNFKVAYANSAGTADSASKVAGVPMRFQENPQSTQPFYLYGVEAGKTEITLYNRTALMVGYAHQLTGQGLQHGGVGGYVLNKNKSGTGLAGGWEQRGQVYDYGSGAVEGNESSAVLWQRTS